MTRRELEDRYLADDDGRIQQAGEFHGAPIYVPYFWHGAVHDLLVPESGRHAIAMVPSTRDLSMFPELKGKRLVVLIAKDGEFFMEEKLT